jgi:hypothetical protein
MWMGEMDTEMPGPGSEEEEYWMKWMREVEETGSEPDTGGEERKERKRETDLARWSPWSLHSRDSRARTPTHLRLQESW